MSFPQESFFGTFIGVFAASLIAFPHMSRFSNGRSATFVLPAPT
jgi:hypothetical protein